MVNVLNRVITAILILLLLSTSLNTFALDRRGRGTNTKKPKEPVVKLPYTIEINEESSKNGLVITLAVGSVTIFRCPEPPTQIIKGIPEALAQEESEEAHKSSDIYIKPTIANIRTNMFVELQTGSIDIQVKTIAINTGAQVGDYNGEVLIRPAKYNEDLAHIRQELKKSKEEIELARDRIAELQKQTDERVKEREDKSAEEFLNLLENSFKNSDKSNSIDGGNGRVRITQIGKATHVKQGWVILFAIENRTKDILTIDEIRADRGTVKVNGSISRRINPREDSKIALLVQPTTETEIPTQINFILGSSTTSVRLRS